MVMPKVYACKDGFRFLAGVDLLRLRNYLQMNNMGGAGSYLGMCRALIDLTPDNVRKLGGFTLVLGPGQVAYVPGGMLVAETPLSRSNTVAFWSTMLPLPPREGAPHCNDFKTQADLAWKLVKCDLAEETTKGANKEGLEKVLAQTELASEIIKWAKSVSSRSPPPVSGDATVATAPPRVENSGNPDKLHPPAGKHSKRASVAANDSVERAEPEAPPANKKQKKSRRASRAGPTQDQDARAHEVDASLRKSEAEAAAPAADAALAAGEKAVAEEAPLLTLPMTGPKAEVAAPAPSPSPTPMAGTGATAADASLDKTASSPTPSTARQDNAPLPQSLVPVKAAAAEPEPPEPEPPVKATDAQAAAQQESLPPASPTVPAQAFLLEGGPAEKTLEEELEEQLQKFPATSLISLCVLPYFASCVDFSTLGCFDGFKSSNHSNQMLLVITEQNTFLQGNSLVSRSWKKLSTAIYV